MAKIEKDKQTNEISSVHNTTQKSKDLETPKTRSA